jgi:exopolysaccharide biosynthesis WecB/TagA/CpsF family protein
VDPAHAEFLNLRFSLAPFERTVNLISERCDGPFAYVVTPNAPHVVMVNEQPERLLPVYRGAWLSLCDSQIVRTLAALGGLSLPLVTGSDLVAALLATENERAAHARGKRILVVGPDVATERVLRARFPALDIEVMPASGHLAQHAYLRLQVARACVEREWDILLLCVGCPAQELIAALIAAEGRKRGVALCVGAAIDFIIGRQVRAPRLLQRFGLEWAYRLAHEPARLWRRYLVEAPKIAHIFLTTHYRARRS